MKAKRIALLLLSVVMILSSLVIVPVSAEEATPPSTPVGYQGFTGTKKTGTTDWDNVEGTELYIGSSADIEKFAALVTSGTNFSGKSVYLTANVKLTNPIGVYGKAFGGKLFDGQGYTVDLNLNCDIATTTYLGMFSQVNNYATIQNVVVTGSVTQTNTADTTHGNFAVGAIVGVASQSAKIINVLNEANVTGLVDHAAGFVGQGHSTLNIENCTNRGNVFGVKSAAGFYAYSSGIISNCVNEGNITSDTRAGGIVCTTINVITINNCVNKGNIVAPYEATGIAAYVNSDVTIKNCCNYGVMDHGEKKATSIGESAIYIKSADTIAVTEENNLDKAIGYDADRAGWDEATLTYTTLSAVDADRTLYSKSVFQIATPADLVALSKLVNESKDYTFTGKTVYLTADIDMKDVKDFVPIGHYATKDDNIAHGTATYYFGGTFNGQGKTISNLNVKVTMTADGVLAQDGTNTAENALAAVLFGWTRNAVIQHLSIVDSSVVHTKTGGNDGIAGTGGLIAKGSATVFNVYMDADVTGFKMTGGVIGRDGSGTIKYVTRDGVVNGGSLDTAGFTVYSGGEIYNSINLGDVKSSGANVVGLCCRIYTGAAFKIEDCVNAGAVTSSSGTPNAATIVLISTANGGGSVQRCINTNVANVNCPFLIDTANKITTKNDNVHDFSGQYLGYSEAFITTSAPAGLKDISEYVSIDAATGALTNNVGSVTAIGIKDANSMRLFSAWVNAGNTGAGKTFYLTGDIDFKDFKFTPDDRTLKEENTFVPIGWDKIKADGNLIAGNNVTEKEYSFSGTFDGLGHTIKNLTLHSEDKAANFLGVFGYAKNAVVRNLVVDDTCKFSTNLAATSTASYNFKIGGLFGYCGGTQVTNVLVKTQIQGGATSGGFVGRGGAKGYTNCTFAGTINGGGHAGGFNAYNGASTYNNCKNVGNITAAANAAGFSPRSSGADVFANCVNYGNITGAAAAGIARLEGSSAVKYIGCANYGVITGTTANEDLFFCSTDTSSATRMVIEDLLDGNYDYKVDERSIEEMLTVSFQERASEEEGKTDVRFITTVDSLNYQKLIYTFTLKGVSRTIESTSAYTSVQANGEPVTDATSIGSDTSAYFSTLDLTDVPEDAVFKVQVSVVTASGDVLAGATWLVDLAN